MNLFIKDTTGKPSASLTFCVIGFMVVTLWLLLSIFEGFGAIKIRSFDATAATAFLGVVFSLYFGRRFTEKPNGNGTGSVPPPAEISAPTNSNDNSV